MRRYQIGDQIGQGGFAVVHKATRRLADNRPQHVIIKRLQPDCLANVITRKRFDLEAAIGLTLAHPHIVKTYDYARIGPDPGIVMECVNGVSLFELAQAKILPADLVRLILVEVAMALAYVHAKGILHRDLSPGNILLSREGEVKLTDFGVAKLVAMPTTSGRFTGTPAYGSPEAIRGEKLEPSADLYALAAVSYELLTGVPPYGHGRTDVIAHRQDPASGYEVTPLPDDVPQDLRFVITDLLQSKDKRRIRSADVLSKIFASWTRYADSKALLAAFVKDALQRAHTSGPPAPPSNPWWAWPAWLMRVGQWLRPQPPSKPRLGWPAHTILSVALLVGVGIGSVWYARDSKSPDTGETFAEAAPAPPVQLTPVQPAVPQPTKETGPQRDTERAAELPHGRRAARLQASAPETTRQQAVHMDEVAKGGPLMDEAATTTLTASSHSRRAALLQSRPSRLAPR